MWGCLAGRPLPDRHDDVSCGCGLQVPQLAGAFLAVAASDSDTPSVQLGVGELAPPNLNHL